MGILGRAAPSGRLQSFDLIPHTNGDGGYRVARAMFFGPVTQALPYTLKYDTTLVSTLDLFELPRTFGITRLRGVGRLRSTDLVRNGAATHASRLATDDFFGRVIHNFLLGTEVAPYDLRCAILYVSDPLAMAPPYDTTLVDVTTFVYQPAPFPLGITRPISFEAGGAGSSNRGYAG